MSAARAATSCIDSDLVVVVVVDDDVVVVVDVDVVVDDTVDVGAASDEAKVERVTTCGRWRAASARSSAGCGPSGGDGVRDDDADDDAEPVVCMRWRIVQ
jgi:hypothetical protein